ncbi:MAG: hypothetical protein ACI915_004725 [Gammaproteobacteria bacterium]|jgi:hypothetical protein
MRQRGIEKSVATSRPGIPANDRTSIVGLAGCNSGRLSAQTMMSPLAVVIVSEDSKFAAMITGVPKEDTVKELTTDCADQSLNERMQLGRIRDGLDLIDLKDAKISFPSGVSK